MGKEYEVTKPAIPEQVRRYRIENHQLVHSQQTWHMSVATGTYDEKGVFIEERSERTTAKIPVVPGDEIDLANQVLEALMLARLLGKEIPDGGTVVDPPPKPVEPVDPGVAKDPK